MVIVESLINRLIPRHLDHNESEPHLNPGEILGQIFVNATDVTNEVLNDAAIVNLATRLVGMINYGSSRFQARLCMLTEPHHIHIHKCVACVRTHSRHHPIIIALMHQMGEEEEDMEGAMEEMEQSEDEYLYGVSQLTENLAKALKERFLPAWAILRETVLQIVVRNDAPLLKRTGIYIFCDVIQHLPVQHELVNTTLSTIVPVMLACLPDENTEHRQAAAFGLGVIAKQCGIEAVAPYLDGISSTSLLYPTLICYTMIMNDVMNDVFD
jgi:hypothetical protein